MTSDEIRQKWEATQKAVIRPADWEAWALCEIAAQLAELNEWLKTPQHIKDMQEAQIRGR